MPRQRTHKIPAILFVFQVKRSSFWSARTCQSIFKEQNDDNCLKNKQMGAAYFCACLLKPLDRSAAMDVRAFTSIHQKYDTRRMEVFYEYAV